MRYFDLVKHAQSTTAPPAKNDLSNRRFLNTPARAGIAEGVGTAGFLAGGMGLGYNHLRKGLAARLKEVAEQEKVIEGIKAMNPAALIGDGSAALPAAVKLDIENIGLQVLKQNAEMAAQDVRVMKYALPTTALLAGAGMGALGYALHKRRQQQAEKSAAAVGAAPGFFKSIGSGISGAGKIMGHAFAPAGQRIGVGNAISGASGSIGEGIGRAVGSLGGEMGGLRQNTAHWISQNKQLTGGLAIGGTAALGTGAAVTGGLGVKRLFSPAVPQQPQQQMYR